MKDDYEIIIKYDMLILLLKVFICGGIALPLGYWGDDANWVVLKVVLYSMGITCAYVWQENVGRLIQHGGKFIKINQKEFEYCYFSNRFATDYNGHDKFPWSEIKSIEYCEKTFSKGILITNLQGIKRYIRVSAVEYDAEEIVEILLDYQKKLLIQANNTTF